MASAACSASIAGTRSSHPPRLSGALTLTRKPARWSKSRMTVAPRAVLATYTVVHIADPAGSPSTGGDCPSMVRFGPHRSHRAP